MVRFGTDPADACGDAGELLDRPPHTELFLYREGRLKLDELVTRELPLDEINTAIDLMEKGEAVRSVVRMD